MRMVFTTAIVAVLAVAAAPTHGTQDVLNDPEGKPLAMILDCNSCQASGDANGCQGGVENGFHDGASCGRCLIDANFGTRIPIPYSSRVSGKLKDENGKPVAEQYVRMLLPNAWGIRTRTAEDGSFTLRLGPTVPPVDKNQVHVDIGERTVRSDKKLSSYFLFMLPPNFKACVNP